MKMSYRKTIIQQFCRLINQRKPIMPGSVTNSPICDAASPSKRPKLGEITNVHHHVVRKVLQDVPSKPSLKVVRMTENAILPTKGSQLSAGYDLYSAYDYKVEAGGKCLCKTDIQIELPPGCYGRVAPRSGLAHKHFLDVGAGVIDEDYRGNVGVILFNFNKEPYQVNKGDRIAQLVCEKIYYPELQEVDSLTDTDRGAGGYGSTGKN